MGGYSTWEGRELAVMEREFLAIALVIKLAALPFTGIAGAARGFFVEMLMEEVEDLAAEATGVGLYAYFRTYTAMIKDTNRKQTI